MRRVRVIPVLLLKGEGLYKSIRFKDYKYVGDPINAVKIFNDKEVDEIVLLDISASQEKRKPDFNKIRNIASEAFMPMAYGGGISSVDDIKRILYDGVEKVVINYNSYINPKLIEDAAKQFGSSSVVASIDYKKDWLGRNRVFTLNGTKNTGEDPVVVARRVEGSGAGEIIVNSISNDGTYKGYDINIVKEISKTVSIPVVICGGASTIENFYEAVNAGASAVAAGSMFVFKRPHNAVLINYPSQEVLSKELYSKL